MFESPSSWRREKFNGGVSGALCDNKYEDRRYCNAAGSKLMNMVQVRVVNKPKRGLHEQLG